MGTKILSKFWNTKFENRYKICVRRDKTPKIRNKTSKNDLMDLNPDHDLPDEVPTMSCIEIQIRYIRDQGDSHSHIYMCIEYSIV